MKKIMIRCVILRENNSFLQGKRMSTYATKFTQSTLKQKWHIFESLLISFTPFSLDINMYILLNVLHMILIVLFKYQDIFYQCWSFHSFSFRKSSGIIHKLNVSRQYTSDVPANLSTKAWRSFIRLLPLYLLVSPWSQYSFNLWKEINNSK